MTSRHSLVAAVLLVVCAGPRASVLVVGPGQPYANLQAAVSAAASGDIVLVESGTYAGFQLSGRGIAIVADAGAAVSVQGGIQISNVPAGETVVLDGINSVSLHPDPLVPFGLLVSYCDGAVRVQQCKLYGLDGNSEVSSYPSCNVTGEKDAFAGVRVDHSADVSFDFCTLQGGIGSSLWDDECHRFKDTLMYGGAGGDGLEAIRSNVSAYDCFLNGESSGFGNYSEKGGDGVSSLSLSTVVLVHTTCTAGNGGDSLDGIAPWYGGPGGNGLFVDGESRAFVLQDVFNPGVQGSGWLDPGGEVAGAVGGNVAAVTVWAGSSKSLAFVKVLREGQATPISVTGAPGDAVLLFASVHSTSFLSSKATGSFVLDPGALIGPVALGTITGAAVSVSATMPSLPAGVDGVDVYLQAIAVGGGKTTLSSWGHLTLLDASF